MKKTLITGASGYIGGRLAQFLSSKSNYEIILGSRNNHNSSSWLPGAKVVPMVWESDQSLEEVCTDINSIVHLAGMNAQDCINDPVKALEFNAVATAHLLQAAIKKGVKRFVYLSSAHVYGSPLRGDITEESCTTSIQPYASSHRAGEDVVLAAHERGDIEGIVIRLSNAFGEPIHKNVNCWMLLVNDLCLQATTTQTMKLRSSGLQRRDFITLTDTCRAIQHLLELSTNKISNGLFNVGGSWNPTILEMTKRLSDRILHITGKYPELNFKEQSDEEVTEYFNYDISKLLNTGFSINNKLNIDDELDRLIMFSMANVIKPYNSQSNKTQNTPSKLMRLSKSCLSSYEKRAVMNALDEEKLGMGDNVIKFEKALTEFFGRPTICVNSGTAALHLAIQACGIGPGDEVLVPSLTYVATFQAISATGAKPIACDIDPQSYILDWQDAESRITTKTKAIMPVHYTGGVGELDEIYVFAKKYNLRVIEDAAHAFGTIYNNKKIGSFGDIACFSFDGIKNITCGEGGCIVSNDPLILKNINDSRLLGVENDAQMREIEQRSWDFQVSKQGWRYHMSNVMAAIGLEQIKRFPVLALTRQNLCNDYDALLKNHPRLEPIARDYSQVVPHIYVIRIKGILNREELRKHLLKYNIQTGIHYKPNHTLNFYYDPTAKPLTTTDEVFPELLTLPLHPDLTKIDVEFICNKLKEYFL